MISRACALAILVLLLVAAPASADFVPEAGSPFAVGNSPQAVDSADFNGDGRRDLATANSGSNSVSVLLRQAGGGFAPELGNPAVAGGPRAIGVADFNGDSRPDMAVASGNSTVTILLRQAVGGFAVEGAPLSTNINPNDVVAADFNGDGRPDLAVTASAAVHVFLRQAGGGFAQEAGSPIDFGVQLPIGAVAADFNADSRLDLAVAIASTQGVRVLLRQAAGGFQQEGAAIPAGEQPTSIVTADFNGDSRPDLAVPDANGFRPITVLLRQAAGGFAPEPSPSLSPSFPTEIASSDFNGDGRPDIAVSHSDTDNVSVLLRQAAGGFAPDQGSPVGVGDSPESVGAADFNADTRPDLAVANGGGASVTVLLNTTPTTDGDGDGVPDAADNCDGVPNPDQRNTDGDAEGDACDGDDDNDGRGDADDNCELAANPGQEDGDGDGLGNACDSDNDNDGHADVDDNCAAVANPDQSDRDSDGIGDVCDPRPDEEGEGGGDVPAEAAFTPSDTSLPQFGLVQLDGSASARPGSEVRSYAWDLNGDGRTDATCGPENPILRTDFSRAGSRTVSLSVTDTTGAVTTAAQTLSIARRGGSGATATAAQRPLGRRVTSALERFEDRLVRAPAPAVCTPGPPGSTFRIGGSFVDAREYDSTDIGGPIAGCVSELQIPETLVAAVGCLQETTYEQLPRPERAIVDSAILGYFEGLGVITEGDEGGGVPGIRECGRPPCPSAATRARSSQGLVDAALLLRRARQIMRGAARFYVSTGSVRINGLDYAPDARPNATRPRIVFAGPGTIGSGPRGLNAWPAIVSSGVTIVAPTPELGNVTLRTKARIALPIDTDGERIAEIRLNKNVPFAEATKLRGKVTALLRDKASDLVLEVALPSIFEKPGGGPVTASVTRTARNGTGMSLTGFEVRNINADILGVGVGVNIEYLRYQTSPRRVLEGKAAVTFLAERIQGEIAVRDGKLELLEVTYQPGPPGIKVCPGLFIYEVSGGFEDTGQLFRIFGSAGLAAGTSLGNGCAPVGVKGGFDFQIDPTPVTLKLRGDLELACIPFGFQELVIASDGYAHFRAALNDFDLGPVKLKAEGRAVFYDGHFTGELGGHAFIELPDPFPNLGVNGNALVSDRGLAMCVGTSVPIFGDIGVGFGLPWSPPPVNVVVLLGNLDIWAPSCDVGPYRTVEIRDARAAQASPVTVAIPRGELGASIDIAGSGAAPAVTLRDPAGNTFAMPESGVLDSEQVLAFKVEQTGKTYVALKRPRAGNWTIEPQAGSAIAEVQRASVLPEPDVSGRVRSRRGAHLVDYDVEPQPGQVVRLLEQAPGGTRELGVVDGRRFRVDAAARGSVRQVARRRNGGTLRLVPSDADGSKRAILALVEQNGLPRERVVLDRFKAGPPGIGKARRIRGRLSRRGRLTISWRRAAGAERYVVGVDLDDGRGLALYPRGRQVRIPGVSRGTRVTVRVLGTRADGARRGPVATRTFRAR